MTLCRILLLRRGWYIWFQVFLSNTNNFESLIDRIVADTSNPCQVIHVSNGNEGETPHIAGLLKGNPITRFGVELYPWYLYIEWVLPISKISRRYILSPTDWMILIKEKELYNAYWLFIMKFKEYFSVSFCVIWLTYIY